MSPIAAWMMLRQLVRDTFRQARASGIFWMMLGITAVCVLLCLSVGVSGDVPIYGSPEGPLFRPPPQPRELAPSIVLPLAGTHPLQEAVLVASAGRDWYNIQLNPEMMRREGVDVIGGTMTIGFGAVTVPLGRDRADLVHFLQLLLAEGVADTIGVLLALVWTAGFLPGFLEPSAASVLLAKPAPRWALLGGKFVGVLIFVAFQAVLFVGLTWLALGARTGVWDPAYLLCIPLLLVQFATFFSFSVLIAVSTRSTVACVLGSILVWFLGYGVNYAWAMVSTVPRSQGPSAPALGLVDVAYWISPKPIDLGLMLFNALDARQHFDRPHVFQVLASRPGFSPEMSVISCLLLTVVVLTMAMYEFHTTDY